MGGPAQADAPLAKGQSPVAATAAAPDLSVEAIFDERMTTGQMAGVFDAIARHFPDEMRAYRTQMIASITAAQAAGAPVPNGIEQGRALLRGVAPLLAGAAESDLTAILDDQIALYAALRGNPRDCARIVIDGIVGADLTDARLAEYDFVARGRPARAAAEVAQYGALAAALQTDAVGVAAIDSIERLDPADPRLCDGAIRVFEALRDARLPGADRLRAEMLVGIMAG